MEFSVDSTAAEDQVAPCIVVGIFDAPRLSHAAESLDKALDGQLRAIVERGDFNGELGRSLFLHQATGSRCERILLVGCGDSDAFDERAYRQAVAAMMDALHQSGASAAVSYLGTLGVAGHGIDWRVREAVRIAEGKCYRSDGLISTASGRTPALGHLTLAIGDEAERPQAEEGCRIGRAMAHGEALSRELGDLPANWCTPVYLAERADQLAAEFDDLSIEILGPEAMDELGMGALGAVSYGSRLEPRLIVMHYQGGDADTAPHALVGKGVTFDSGGISIKPAASMDEMKYDMAGAASVFGAVRAAAELGLGINVLGVIPAVENMPDGNAYRPGDVVTTLSGQTVEIINTDAEGRLALCDALTYTARYRPQSIVDIATLTGSCIIALGEHAHGLMGNNDSVIQSLLAAGRETGDRAWQLPLWPEYDEQLKSNFADCAHVGGRQAGTITAGCFLARFSADQNWAHLDIAGTGWRSGEHKGATGRPAPLLTQYLLDQAG